MTSETFLESRPVSVAGTLAEQARLYREMLGLLAEEEQALRAGRGGAVAETLPRKEALVAEMEDAERRRRDAVQRLTGHRDTPLYALPGPDREQIEGQRAELRDLLGRVATTSERVEVLLQRSLSRLEITVEMIHDALGLGAAYTPEARLVRTAVPTLDGRA